jgi:hypothetical protein
MDGSNRRWLGIAFLRAKRSNMFHVGTMIVAARVKKEHRQGKEKSSVIDAGSHRNEARDSELCSNAQTSRRTLEMNTSRGIMITITSESQGQ